ncbi:MAG: cytochrome c-type biogenesis protein CcmH [Amylibacter sp.]|nr:cytochrome c-type biogenesis protein CcmH [Amylibacter sp.]
MYRLLLLLCVCATPAFAVFSDEVLDDPILESRARELSKELRCLVCRNENIDSSNAGIARDLRLLVRERLSEGDADAEVMTFIVDRYGEYVLLRPPFSPQNAILYLVGPLTLVFGAVFSVFYLRRRTFFKGSSESLSPHEEERLSALLDE